MNDYSTQPSLDLEDADRGHANLTNMSLCLQALLECRNSPIDTARMGIFHGFSGYGKTYAAGFTVSRTGAVYLRARRLWTEKTFLEALAHELSVPLKRRTAADLLNQIIEHLKRQPVDLIIDEMDYLADKGLVETIRDIHDDTRIAVLMIGEEALPAKLQRWERFDNRIVTTFAAQPATVDDARKLRDHYRHRVDIADDLVELIRQRCKGVTRRIVGNLDEVSKTGRRDGVTMIDAKWWGNRPIRTGEFVTRKAV